VLPNEVLKVSAPISADLGTLPTRKTLRIFELDFRSDPRWERFVSAHPDALIYHHPGWLSALENEYGEKCISLACSDENRQLSAILPSFIPRAYR
jgi:hypothetical protein